MISSVVWLLVVMFITLLVDVDYFASVGGCLDVCFWLLLRCGFWLCCYVWVWLMLVGCLCDWYAVNSVVLIYF